MAPGVAACLAVAGALAGEFIFYLEPHRFDGWPAFVTKFSYWVPVLVGCGFAALFCFMAARDADMTWYTAVYFGVSWRLVVTDGAKRTPAPKATNVN